MLPQVGAGGGTPRPKKSSEVRISIAPLILKGRNVITETMLLGSMCLSIIFVLDNPKVLAAITYSIFLPFKNSART